jgi:hypothetical protein
MKDWMTGTMVLFLSNTGTISGTRPGR